MVFPASARSSEHENNPVTYMYMYSFKIFGRGFADIMGIEFTLLVFYCRSICGTPNYISPEVILKAGHSYPVDVWAMGCIV